MARSRLSTAAVLLLVGLLATASASHVRSPSFFRRSLLSGCTASAKSGTRSYSGTAATGELCAGPDVLDANLVPATSVPKSNKLSGLQDAAPTANGAATRGTFRSGVGLFKTAADRAPAAAPDSWGRTITYSQTPTGGAVSSDPDVCEVDATGTANDGITISNYKLDQKDYIWILDTDNLKALKLDTTSTATTVIAGTYITNGAPVRLRTMSSSRWFTNLIAHLQWFLYRPLCRLQITA